MVSSTYQAVATQGQRAHGESHSGPTGLFHSKGGVVEHSIKRGKKSGGREKAVAGKIAQLL